MFKRSIETAVHQEVADQSMANVMSEVDLDHVVGALNPQPIPPGSSRSLNPQPIPPGSAFQPFRPPPLLFGTHTVG